MIEIGAYDAKTQFSSLLDKVQQGEEIVITRHGRPVAVLSPHPTTVPPAADDDFERRFSEARKGACLGGLKLKDLIEAGRR
jgi:prevent-host-death family protein